LATITYKDSGVDINKGNKAVKKIKEKIHSTYSNKVLTNLGSFGGMFEISNLGLKEPVLVSSVDGVGTKLKIAFKTGKHDTIGEDLVNHCVNDIAVGGANPLFFLDYFATAQLDVSIFENVVSGFVRGCKNNNCALIGGETAEMPDIYNKNEYDISGTIVGVVEKNRIINGSKIQKGDVLIGVSSNGLHTNGYSLAIKVLLNQYNVDSLIPDLGYTLGEELLRIHCSYLCLIQDSVNKLYIHGISHITGGGIEGNTKRLLKKELQLKINWNNWKRPHIFNMIQSIGNVPEDDMRSTFNLGIGLIFVIPENQFNDLMQLIEKHKLKYYKIGIVI
jgi:phosphoribosylformylglycinamidine cyclo-ligase